MKKIDPWHYVLKLILKKFTTANLLKEEQEFINDNIKKHRMSLWINAISIAFTYWGLLDVPKEKIDTMILALLGPVVVTGSAWFAISFGGIPAKLIHVAMAITFWMFTGFIVSLSTMLLAVAFISPPQLWPVLGIVYLGTVFSCIQYDTADGLKAGLDEAMLKHSRAALKYYKKEGIEE